MKVAFFGLMVLMVAHADYFIYAGTGGCDDSDLACDNSPTPAVSAYRYSEHDQSLSHAFSFQPRGLPSWLKVVNQCLIVPWTDSRYIESYQIIDNGTQLKFRNKMATGGMNPVFIDAFDKNPHTIVVANYHGPDDGTDSTGAGITSMTMETNCTLAGTNFHQTTGRSVNPGRQASSHLHSTVVDPFTDNMIFACDLGADTVTSYNIDPIIRPLTSFNTTPGSGPRHLVFHPRKQGIVYLLHEMGQYIAVLSRDQDTHVLKEVQRISTLRESVFPGYTKASEILVTSDAKFVLASNRGYGINGGTVAVYRISSDGLLETTGSFDVGDQFPRGMELLPDGRTLVVAGQSKSMIRVFNLKEDGTLTQVGDAIKGPPHPTTIAYARVD